MNRTFLKSALCACALVAASAANAATWTASGSLTNVSNLPIFNIFPSWINSGDTYTFSYDVNTAAGGIEVAGVKTYSRPYQASLTLNDTQPTGNTWTYNFTSLAPVSGDFVQVANAAGGDAFTVFATDLLGVNALLTLTGQPNIFTSTALPSSQPNYADFSFRQFVFNIGLEGFTGTVSAVPLPAAAWLMLSGLVGVAAFARRRRREEPSTGASSVPA